MDDNQLDRFKEKLRAAGLTIADAAKKMNISRQSVYNYANEMPWERDFCEICYEKMGLILDEAIFNPADPIVQQRYKLKEKNIDVEGDSIKDKIIKHLDYVIEDQKARLKSMEDLLRKNGIHPDQEN